MRRIRRFLLLALVLVWPTISDAKDRAILIGVSNYQLPAIPRLSAPKNDVALMWDLLRDRGFLAEDIVVLADEIDPDHKEPIPLKQPIASNILSELDALAAKVQKGDFVVVYYSGHGSYIRQRTPKVGDTIEKSGFNQVLLALDAQEADYIKAEVPGSILDKVLRAKFDAIKEKTFLWLILDACHAGGLTRDGTVDATIHFVPPKLLKLDDTPPPARADPNRWIANYIGGKQVAFLAAPEDSPAFEKPVSELGNKPYSLFTLSIVRLLKAENFGSYRSLGEAIISKQAALAGNIPTPAIEGDLDQPIFDGSVAGPRAWDARYNSLTGRFVVDAGSIQGIAAGTIVRLETAQGVAGYGEIENSTILSSVGHPIAFQGKTKPSTDQLKEKMTARVERSTIDLTLKVAAPPAVDSDGSEQSKLGLQAVQILKQDQLGPLPLRWLTAGQAADVQLRVINGVIYLVPGTGELVRTGRYRSSGVAVSDSPPDTAHALREDLWRVLRQLNLRRAADEVQRTDFAKAVEVHLQIIRDEGEFQSVTSNERQPCKSWERDNDVTAPVDLKFGSVSGTKLTHCDRVGIKVINRWPKAVDVTLLYLDSEGGIGIIGGDDPRVEAGKEYFPTKFQPVRIVTWCDDQVWTLCKSFKTAGDQPVGKEGLMIIVTEAGATKHSYYYLAQDRLEKAVEIRGRAQRGGAPLEEILMDAGLHPGQGRRSVDKTVPGTIKFYSWNVVPPAELGKR